MRIVRSFIDFRTGSSQPTDPGFVGNASVGGDLQDIITAAVQYDGSAMMA